MGCLFLICSGESTPSNMTKICGGPTNLQHFDISLNISGRGYEHTKMLSLLPKLPKSLRLCHLANIKKNTDPPPIIWGQESHRSIIATTHQQLQRLTAFHRENCIAMPLELPQWLQRLRAPEVNLMISGANCKGASQNCQG